jgi:myo-inositol-1(or 4)-monophosphatase
MTENYAETIKFLMKEAGKIILSAHIDRQDGVTEKEGNANFVTVYDVKTQDYLIDGIKKAIPDAVFMAEEQDNDTSVLNAGHCFIIDPIDGTTNFIRDCKHSCISVAMLERGVTVFGAVYDPYLDELFTAERGKGAFLNGKRITVSETPFNKAICGYGTAPYYRDTLGDKTFEVCKKLFMSCADVRRCGSAALDLAYLAAGRYDLFFECRLSPWDYAAGVLLIEEAGGKITDMSGEPLVLDKPCSVMASSQKLYPELYRTVNK